MSSACSTFETLYASRKNNFNLLRLFFALMVIFSHVYSLTRGHDLELNGEPLYRWSHGRLDFGTLAVDAFFMISGFLLVGSWTNSHGILNFLWRRVLRIYPGLLVCMSVCIFIVGPLGGANLHTYFTNPLTYRLYEYVFMRNFWNGVPDAFSTNPVVEINSPLWTIKYEIFCYICLALMGLVRLIRPVTVLILFMVVFAFYNVLFARGMQPLFSLNSLPGIAADFLVAPMPRFLTFFLGGSVFYLWRARIPHSSLLFIASLVIIFIFYYEAVYLVLPVFGGYCLFYLSLLPQIRLPLFDEFDLSYGVYMYGWPVGQLVVYYHWVSNNEPLLLFVLTLPPVFVLAALSWIFIERPCLKLKKTVPGFMRSGKASIENKVKD